MKETMKGDGPVLALEAMTVRYGRTTALDAVSLEVLPGSVYALLGRNGAGKTSAVRCLLGQRKPDAGRAFLFGREVWTGRAEAMLQTGVVPEEPEAPPEMTAAQIVAFCSRLYPRWNGAEVDDRLTRFSVPRDVPFGRLSKGQKGMVALALALGPSPQLLIMDDPTLGLDAVARKAFFEELVGDLAERATTVFITSHDLRGIEGIASHVGLLKEGRMLVEGEMEALKTRFRRIRLVAGQDAPKELQSALSDFKVLSYSRLGSAAEAVVDGFEEPAFERLRQRPWALEAEAPALPLEELFIALVGEGNGGAA
jgi:ABC-2 type transport system ATP-binding protein